MRDAVASVAQSLAAGARSAGGAKAGHGFVADHDAGRFRAAAGQRVVLAGRSVCEKRHRVGAGRGPGDDRRRGRPGRAGEYRRPAPGGPSAVDLAGARRAGPAKRRSARRPRRCGHSRADAADGGANGSGPRFSRSDDRHGRRQHAIRLEDLGEVRDATKEVRTLARLDGKPAVVLQVQRQSRRKHGRVIQGDQGAAAAVQGAVAATSRSDGHSGPVALHPGGAARNRRAPGRRQHSGQHHGAAVHEVVALDVDRGGGDSRVADLDVRVHEAVRLHAQQRDDAGPGADGGRGDRRRDRRAGKRVSLHRRKGNGPGRRRRFEGTREIGPAVLATTISLVIVFLPVSFLSSVTGRMLFQFGITATVAILVSMLVSFTLTPMMCSKLLTPRHGQSERARRRAAAGMA